MIDDWVGLLPCMRRGVGEWNVDLGEDGWGDWCGLFGCE